MVIVGVMPVYEEEDWVEWAVRGIIDFVDELVIAEGYQGPAWHFGGCRSKDKTIEIIKALSKEYDKITLTECQSRRHVLKGKAATHNHVLRVSRRIKDADWFFIIDSDEFYTDAQKSRIRQILEKTDKDAIRVSARMFFYNFNYYIDQTMGRIIRVTNQMFFKPGQFPHYADGTPYFIYSGNSSKLILQDDPMFHYSFVKRPSSEIKRRLGEYCATQQDESVFDWIDEVFLRWSPERAKEIYAWNQKRFNKNGISFGGSQQRLKFYSGDHPDILNNHPFRYIDDVRSLEKLEKSASEYILVRHRLAHHGLRFLQKVKALVPRRGQLRCLYEHI